MTLRPTTMERAAQAPGTVATAAGLRAEKARLWGDVRAIWRRSRAEAAAERAVPQWARAGMGGAMLRWAARRQALEPLVARIAAILEALAALGDRGAAVAVLRWKIGLKRREAAYCRAKAHAGPAYGDPISLAHRARDADLQAGIAADALETLLSDAGERCPYCGRWDVENCLDPHCPYRLAARAPERAAR